MVSVFVFMVSPHVGNKDSGYVKGKFTKYSSFLGYGVYKNPGYLKGESNKYIFVVI